MFHADGQTDIKKLKIATSPPPPNPPNFAKAPKIQPQGGWKVSLRTCCYRVTPKPTRVNHVATVSFLLGIR